MSNYMLYGSKIIEDDSTIKKFAESIFKNLQITYSLVSKYEDYEDFKIESLENIFCFLRDDVSRTGIKYEELMYKYRFDIGDLLYELDKVDYSLFVSVNFFGNKAKTSFEEIMLAYCEIHFDELLVEE